MKILPVLFTTLLVLAACSSDDDDDSDLPNDGDGSTSVADQVRAIEGRWSFRDEATGCETVLAMEADDTLVIADGTFVSTSLDEISSGTYALERIAEGTLLSLTVQMDSPDPNCDGESDENLDPIDTLVRFPDEDTMEWYFRDPDSGEVTVTLVFLRAAPASGLLI